jgi:hypothetical protein
VAIVHQRTPEVAGEIDFVFDDKNPHRNDLPAASATARMVAAGRLPQS